MSLFACAGRPPEGLGVASGRLAPCPGSPNCVSSDAADEAHRVAPFELLEPGTDVWPEIRAAVLALPRTRIVDESPGYLHAECRSAILGFVDDLELHLRPDEGEVAVRSASRLGYSDLGVNRRRVETLRETLAETRIAR